jgi:hypothetical protein
MGLLPVRRGYLIGVASVTARNQKLVGPSLVAEWGKQFRTVAFVH